MQGSEGEIANGADEERDEEFALEEIF